MNVKIYQPFFKDADIVALDSNCHHIDLRNQTREEAIMREYTINLRCREMAIAEGLDVWGMVSWKYRSKILQITGVDYPVSIMLDVIKFNPEYDVYFFDIYPRIMDMAWNVWEHGQWMHPNMIEICEELFPIMGLDINLLYLPMGRGVSCYANYYMGNRKFWDGWLDLIAKYLAAIPKLSEKTQLLHNGPSDYGLEPDLWYFPFIHERLFSTYILMNLQTLKVFGVHLPGHHVSKRDEFLSTVYDDDWNINKDVASEYFNKRKQEIDIMNYPDLATDWLENKLKVTNAKHIKSN